MTAPFRKSFLAGWGDMDFNAHMRNTSYLDRSGDVRMMYFQEHGFPMSEFARLRIGPVILRDEIEYFRELHLLDPFEVTLTISALTSDASRFRLRNEFFRQDGKMCARVTSHGGWLDLATRKLTIPPAELIEAIRAIVRSEDFAEL